MGASTEKKTKCNSGSSTVSRLSNEELCNPILVSMQLLFVAYPSTAETVPINGCMLYSID